MPFTVTLKGEVKADTRIVMRLRAERVNQVWSYDFIFDQTEDGRRLKWLPICDEFSRELVASGGTMSRNFSEQEEHKIKPHLLRSLPKHTAVVIELVQRLANENRPATDEERHMLVKYVGWGGLPQVFADFGPEEWQPERDRLKTLITPEQYEVARASTLNAHYTSPKVIGGIYEEGAGVEKHLQEGVHVATLDVELLRHGDPDDLAAVDIGEVEAVLAGTKDLRDLRGDEGLEIVGDGFLHTANLLRRLRSARPRPLHRAGKVGRLA